MSDPARFQRLAGIFAILMPVAVIGNVITLFASVNNNAGAFTQPALLLEIGARGAALFHWSMVFDLFGYLAFAPVAVFFWRWLKSKNEGLVSLYTLCGLAYTLIGSMGAAMLGAVVPKLIGDYALASAAQRQTLQALVGALYRFVAYGLWNPLEVLMISAWFLGIGSLLRWERRGLGILALVIGLVAILDPLGWILNNDLLFNLGGGGTVLEQAWSVWLGISLLGKSV